MPPISRREFLRTGTFAVLGAAAVACGKPSGLARGGTLADVVGGRKQKLQIISAGTEILSGTPERVAFGILNPSTGVPLRGGGGRIWVAVDQGTKALGPFPITFRGEGLADRGAYTAIVTFPADGTWLMIVEASPEGFGEQNVLGAANVLVGPQTRQPKVGEAAISVATPTVDDARGVDPICTRQPSACSLHAVSLDDALKSGEPTVMIIATPRFCKSVLCGPEVDILQDVSEEFAGKANFIHVEVLENDDEETVARNFPLSPAAEAWRLEAEPATYFIDAAGLIVERFLGPMDRQEARDATRALVA